jgi:hypothetical protein
MEQRYKVIDINDTTKVLEYTLHSYAVACAKRLKAAVVIDQMRNEITCFHYHTNDKGDAQFVKYSFGEIEVTNYK